MLDSTNGIGPTYSSSHCGRTVPQVHKLLAAHFTGPGHPIDFFSSRPLRNPVGVVTHLSSNHIGEESFLPSLSVSFFLGRYATLSWQWRASRHAMTPTYATKLQTPTYHIPPSSDFQKHVYKVIKNFLNDNEEPTLMVPFTDFKLCPKLSDTLRLCTRPGHPEVRRAQHQAAPSVSQCQVSTSCIGDMMHASIPFCVAMHHPRGLITLLRSHFWWSIYLFLAG